MTLKIIYIYFDLPGAPYPGWEFRVSELLADLGHEVYVIPRHRCIYEKKIPIPPKADLIYVSNPMAVDIGWKIKEQLKTPLVVNFLDIPNELFGSETWRINEYQKIKPYCTEANLLTAISETTAKDVEKWLGKDCPPIKVNYIGVDLDVYKAFEPTTEDYICGVVRGLAKQKKHEEIITAVELSKTKPKLQLIFGNHSDPQKAKVMSKCLFGLGMSTLEGFGVYTVEFAYYAKPFICRKLGVFEELYGDKLVYVDTVEEMAEKIDWLVQDVEARKKIGLNLQRHIQEKKLYLSEHALRLEKILCNILETT